MAKFRKKPIVIEATQDYSLDADSIPGLPCTDEGPSEETDDRAEDTTSFRRQKPPQ